MRNTSRMLQVDDEGKGSKLRVVWNWDCSSSVLVKGEKVRRSDVLVAVFCRQSSREKTATNHEPRKTSLIRITLSKSN